MHVYSVSYSNQKYSLYNDLMTRLACVGFGVIGAGLWEHPRVINLTFEQAMVQN